MGAPDTYPYNCNQSVPTLDPPTPSSSPSSADPRMKSCNYLPEGYIPGPWDVICQRGKDCHEHIGNRRFRECVELFVNGYVNSKTRQEKSLVISSIVKHINDNAKGTHGGFVMKDTRTQRWHHVDNKVARDKVGNALRDAIKQRQDLKMQATPYLLGSTGISQQRNSSLSWMYSALRQENIFTPHSFGNSEHHENPATSQTLNGDLLLQHHHTEQFHPLTFFDEIAASDAIIQADQVQSNVGANQMLSRRSLPHNPFCHPSQYTNDPLDQISPYDLDQLDQNAQHSGDSMQDRTVATRMCIEALAESMDTDDIFDLEPRPIEMFR